MEYRTFGRSGLRVSELVMGGGWVGGILIHADDDTKREAVRRALAAGINWIDTAPMYGQGQSEQALGWLLADVAQRPYVSTKVYLDVTRLDDVAGQVERSLHESLERLKLDSVELFQLHNPIADTRGDGVIAVADVLRSGGVADVFERLREQGLFRLTGITALGSAAACVEVIDSGRFDSAQVYYNLLNPSAGHDTMPPAWRGTDYGGLMAACRRNGTAVMVIRVFAAGVIATDTRTGREIPVAADFDLAREEARARAVFETLGDAYGSRAQTAIRFALANDDVACVVFGLAELGHLEEALRGASMGPLPDAALRRVQQLWETDFGLGAT